MLYLLILLGILTVSVVWVGVELRQVRMLLTPPPPPPEVDAEWKVGEPAFRQTVSEPSPGFKVITDFQFGDRQMQSAKSKRQTPPTKEELAELDEYLAR